MVEEDMVVAFEEHGSVSYTVVLLYATTAASCGRLHYLGRGCHVVMQGNAEINISCFLSMREMGTLYSHVTLLRMYHGILRWKENSFSSGFV